MSFISGGGNAGFLSGNTFYWRVSFNDDYSVMTCVKTADDLWVGSDHRLGHDDVLLRGCRRAVAL
jgi:hypothetical protein